MRGFVCSVCKERRSHPRQDSAQTGVCLACRMKGEPTEKLVAQLPDIDDGLGVGKDAPVEVNEHGGKQSRCLYRCDLLPAHAVLAVAQVLKEGAEKYGEDNWHNITAQENINHAMIHLLAIRAGDTTDDHLEHAACRILFALDQVRSGRDAKLKGAKK